VTPLDYARDTIQRWAQRHVSHPGNHSICGGDFNSIWDAKEHGGRRLPHSLRDWASGVGWKSRRADLPHQPKCITRPSTQLTGGSVIDHVIYNSPTMQLLYYAVGTDGLWIGLSDYRPVLFGFTRQAHLRKHLNAINGRRGTASKNTGARRLPPFRLNFLPCSAFNVTSVTYLFPLDCAAGPRPSTELLALTRLSRNGNWRWRPSVSRRGGVPAEVWGTGLSSSEWRSLGHLEPPYLRPYRTPK